MFHFLLKKEKGMSTHNYRAVQFSAKDAHDTSYTQHCVVLAARVDTSGWGTTPSGIAGGDFSTCLLINDRLINGPHHCYDIRNINIKLSFLKFVVTGTTDIEGGLLEEVGLFQSPF